MVTQFGVRVAAVAYTSFSVPMALVVGMVKNGIIKPILQTVVVVDIDVDTMTSFVIVVVDISNALSWGAVKVALQGRIRAPPPHKEAAR